MRVIMHSRIIFIFAVMVWLCVTVFPTLQKRITAAEGSSQGAVNADAKVLEGRWIRTDGGYVLELKNIADDGTLTAAYFNPQPIRVFQDFWATDEGALAVFIELRDVNYPGSKYSLRYDPAADRLRGLYFQAIEQQLYEIEFVRNR